MMVYSFITILLSLHSFLSYSCFMHSAHFIFILSLLTHSPQLVMHYTSLLPLNYHSTLHTLVCHYHHFTLYVFTIPYIVHFSTYCYSFYFSFASSTSTRHLLSNFILIASLSFICMAFILIPIPNTALLSFYCYTLWL
jgi:hypothetical protein